MLIEIFIKNFVLVKELHLLPKTGLTTITGETGAGKSIIVDAIQLALGERASSGVVHEDADVCDITLVFALTPRLKAWLQQHDLFDEDNCIIQRVIEKNGSSRTRINGRACTQRLVRELAEQVFTIHSQHQGQALLKREQQQQQLDNYANNNHYLAEIADYYHRWQTLQQEINALTIQAQERDAQLSLLHYQLEEITQLNLQAGEWQQLSTEHRRLHQAKQLIQQLNQALQLTREQGENSAEMLVNQALQTVQTISIEDDKITHIKQLLDTAMIHLQEANGELDHYRHALDLSPEHLANVEQRLNTIYEIARKHHVEPVDLMTVEKSLQQKIDALENYQQRVQVLTEEQQKIANDYHHVANKLTKRRQQAATELSQKITASMQTLNLTGGKFHVELQTQPDKLSLHGHEKIVFLVSTNPKQAVQPLTKIVSGGELSRIHLALQVITAQKDNTPTLLFDEVDTGISGQTAAVVGQLLRELGEQVQVFCITHLPQVAAHGHHHWKVDKHFNEQTGSLTAIAVLDHEGRIHETARLLSGQEISQHSIEQATELLH